MLCLYYMHRITTWQHFRDGEARHWPTRTPSAVGAGRGDFFGILRLLMALSEPAHWLVMVVRKGFACELVQKTSALPCVGDDAHNHRLHARKGRAPMGCDRPTVHSQGVPS